MNYKFNRMSKYLLASLVAVALVGCFKILNVIQPSSATVGDNITSTVTVSVEGQTDANPHYGIVGLLVPNDWSINSVIFTGAYTDSCSFLPADSSDKEPTGVNAGVQSISDLVKQLLSQLDLSDEETESFFANMKNYGINVTA